MTLIESLQPISDFRQKQGQRYPLIAVLLITIMSIMSGRCRYREIAVFANANRKELLRFFPLQKRKRLPAHVNFREILKGVDFDKVIVTFDRWASQYVTLDAEEWMAMDGKAPASTYSQRKDAVTRSP
ncbi:MAG: transposase family protein [bacterium]|nr:transposase family protein [bacterium]